MKAMILAAGRGERMGKYTINKPKPLLKVNGHYLIEHQLKAFAKAGIEDIVINVCYHSEQIIQTLGNGERYGVNINYSIENELLGYAGGIYNALPLLGDHPFIIHSADIWSNYPLTQLKHSTDHLAHLILVDNPPFHPRGDFSLYAGKVGAFGLNKLNYGGIAILHPDLFQDCKPGVMHFLNLLQPALQQGQVSGEFHAGEWFNVGTPDVLMQLQQRLV